jgi:Raf kinase inhibitor-like YbhB/YbcL family protein
VEGATFATEYTCAAGTTEKSLPLAWTAGPSETKSYAIVFQDTNNNFNHWVVWDIPPTITMLPEGLPNDATLTTVGNAKQKAGSGEGYLGPCPSGMLHTYVFTVYALDVATLPDVTASRETMALSATIQMHDIASAKLSGKSDAKMP